MFVRWQGIDVGKPYSALITCVCVWGGGGSNSRDSKIAWRKTKVRVIYIDFVRFQDSPLEFCSTSRMK